MLVHFQIEYYTRWGQQVVIQFRLKERTFCIDMSNDGCGNWFTDYSIDDDVHKSLTAYTYMVKNGNVIERRENSCHTLPNTDADRIVLFDRWLDSFGTQIEQRPITIPHVHESHSPLWKGAGTTIPIFSLRSEQDYGIGEFTDLKLLVDWAVKSGQSVIQLLPVNDTTLTRTWRDSYPYSANSSFALNPVYINLKLVGKLNDSNAAANFEQRGKELNDLPEVDYEAVLALKTSYLDLLFAQYGESHMSTPQFYNFFCTNRDWLEPYAVYCCLRDMYGTPNFHEWKEKRYTAQLFQSLYVPKGRFYNEIRKCFFVQYHLDKQLTDVRIYANRHGILLKGDIPIGVNRNSVDVWVHPDLFHTDCQAGAPPDMFARDGQKWGLPTYNWDNMSKDGYKWFVNRLKTMARYFNAYRIDHLLGFFRIWEVPLRYCSGLMGRFNPSLPYSAKEIKDFGLDFTEEAYTQPRKGTPETDILFLKDSYANHRYHPRILGYETNMFSKLIPNEQQAYRKLHEDYYYHRNEQLWYNTAMAKLPALIESTEMLACGEDLGMIPSCVPEVMNRLRILGLEVQRMPKTCGYVVGDPSTYPYMSVCTTSTHDMTVLREWLSKEMPDNAIIKEHNNNSDHCRKVIEMHLESQSMLAIFPLQDWLSIDDHLKSPNPERERINVPADSNNYWKYRMHLTIEQLLQEDEFNKTIAKMLVAYGR